MNFAELTAEVLSIVKRPDMLPRIESAVRAATLKAHRQGFFYKDLVESGVSFTTPAYIQNFLPKDIFGPAYRKLKYIRYWHFSEQDSNKGSRGRFLTPIDIENSVDAYGYDKVDAYYFAGQVIQIRTAIELSHCLAGAYLNPIVATPETFNSWIADDQPYAIVYEACRQIFNQIGKPSDAQDMQQALVEEYIQLRTNSDNRPGE